MSERGFMQEKYWSFYLNHPVDIAIACRYVAEFFNVVGKTPAECWSWFNKTTDCQLNYANRTPVRRIVFDTTNRCWLLKSNINSEVSRKVEFFTKSVDNFWGWRDIAERSGCVLGIPFEDIYEEHMQKARDICLLSDSEISRIRRLLDLELSNYNREVADIKRHEAELAAEYHRSKHTNYQGDLLPFYKKYGY